VLAKSVNYHIVNCFEWMSRCLQWYTNWVYCKCWNHPITWIWYVHISSQF